MKTETEEHEANYKQLKTTAKFNLKTNDVSRDRLPHRGANSKKTAKQHEHIPRQLLCLGKLSSFHTHRM